MRSKKGAEITKVLLRGILLAGGIAVATTSPYFVTRIIPRIIRSAKYRIKEKKESKAFRNSFYYLKNRGLVRIENRKGQVFIYLTEEGKKVAGRYKINDLKIKKPKTWDRKWRILIFDIKDKQRIKREALRGKIKELGLFQLQKSVWVHPYDFQNEINLLRSFFFLNKKELQIIVASKIEYDQKVKSFFKLH